MITHPDYLACTEGLASLLEVAPEEVARHRKEIEASVARHVPAPTADELKMSEQMGVTLAELTRVKARAIAADRAATSLSDDEKRVAFEMGLSEIEFAAARDGRAAATKTLRGLSETQIALLNESCGGDVVAMAQRARDSGWTQ